jgi:hypothetical protein
MLRGTLLSFDAADGVGTILLEDGREVRFGMSALRGSLARPEPGTLVVVDDVAPGLAGRIKATGVRLATDLQTKAERFETLLGAVPTFAELFSAHEALDEDERLRLGPALIEWVFQHRDRLLLHESSGLLRAVPEAGRPLDRRPWIGDLLAAYDAALARAEAEGAARRSPQGRLALRPDFADVGRLFGVVIPTPLRLAWARAYEREADASPRFVLVARDRLDELTQAAVFASEEHLAVGDLAPLTGLPFRVLPFARDREPQDYFALDLAHPTMDSDYPVLFLPHDSLGALRKVAETSAAWLLDPIDPADEADDGGASEPP